MHIVGIENLVKETMLWFAFVLNAILNMSLKSYMPEPPYHILRRLESIAYLIDLPLNMSISPVFNVTDLFPYRGTFKPPVLPFLVLQACLSI